MSVRLRPARAPDALALAALSGALGHALDAPTATARLTRILSLEEHHLQVAELDGAVIGFVHACVIESFQSGPGACLQALAVAAQARRRGVARALVRSAETWARGRGLARMLVRSRVERADAHALYRALGYAESKQQRLFERPLAGR